jgi:uncharacterized membrane protein YtjA (UPF0391 family)
LAVAVLAIALVAGVLGFIGVTSYSWGGAETAFFGVFVFAVLALLAGWFIRNRAV